MSQDQQLILVSARKSRGSGRWSDEDYDVRLGNANGPVIGRIFRAVRSPNDRPWFWTITAALPQGPTQRGYATTREEAMAAFRLAWDPIPTGHSASGA